MASTLWHYSACYSSRSTCYMCTISDAMVAVVPPAVKSRPYGLREIVSVVYASLNLITEVPMRVKSEIRLTAERLRVDEGLSYTEISAQLGISKSTLSNWLRDLPLAAELQERLKERLAANRATFASRALEPNRQRHLLNRQGAYAAGSAVASQVPQMSSVKELALAMLYLGEGSKSYNRVQMASTNPIILRFFIESMEQLFGFSRYRCSLRLNLVEIAQSSEDEFKSWWSQQLECVPGQFSKTQFDRRSHGRELVGDYHGVCTATYYNTAIQQHLLGVAETFIESCFRSKTKDTAIRE